MFRKLKNKWGITSNTQLFLILFIFAITGSTSVYAKVFIFNLLNLSEGISLWIKIPAYLLIITPAYYVFLLIYAFIFRQFSFFWNMEKRTFNAIFRRGRKS